MSNCDLEELNITFNDSTFINNNSCSDKFQITSTDCKPRKKVEKNNCSEFHNHITTNIQNKCLLKLWGLPENILHKYESKGVVKMFEWQAECLGNQKVLEENCNLVYSAPTSAGKTLVAEILAIKTIIERQKKVMIILPFVSVVREKMFYFQDILSSSGIRVDGFMGTHNPPGGFKTVQLAVCTIEKANGIVNRLLEDNTLGDLGAVITDEIHLVSDSSRGYLLELLLTKLRYMSKKSEEINIQLIGMSATLPNLNLLSKWLEAELYTTNFRPIPLCEYYLVDNEIFDNESKLQRRLESLPELSEDTDHILQLCLETINSSCSVLIFCPTKNWCENLAQQISIAFWKLGRCNSEYGLCLRKQLNGQLIAEILEQLQGCPVGLDSVLKKTVSFGVAFHHAGLTMDERDIIEGAFRNGALRILVATSTLSSGVNLPARRVIVRTPLFHGKPIDILTYRQMIGRAGRMGRDTAGESILVCQKTNKNIGADLMSIDLQPIESCLEGAGKLKRAILEVIASGVASTPKDVKLFTDCTLLACSDRDCSQIANPIEVAVEFLRNYEFIRLQTNESGEMKYIATALAKACLSSSLPPEDGLALFEELEKARKCFVLDSDLHLLYLVTPYSSCNQWSNLDWMLFLDMWEKLSSNMRRVADIIGIQESYIFNATRGNINTSTSKLYHKLQIHRRFYTALALQDLINEIPLNVVADKFSCSRGMLQSLQQSASTFAGMVTTFCHQLGWHPLQILISQFQDRLQFGIQHELLELMKLPVLNGSRARTLYNAGIKTLADLASYDVCKLENILHSSVPFQSEKERDGETSFDVNQRKKKRSIWITGKNGYTPYEAALMFIEDARNWLQLEMGACDVKWNSQKYITNETKTLDCTQSNYILSNQTSLIPNQNILILNKDALKLEKIDTPNMNENHNTSKEENFINNDIREKKLNSFNKSNKDVSSLEMYFSDLSCSNISPSTEIHANTNECIKTEFITKERFDSSNNTLNKNSFRGKELCNKIYTLEPQRTDENLKNDSYNWTLFSSDMCLTNLSSAKKECVHTSILSNSLTESMFNKSINTPNKSNNLFNDSLYLDSKFCQTLDNSLTNTSSGGQFNENIIENINSHSASFLKNSDCSTFNDNLHTKSAELKESLFLENAFNSSFSINISDESCNTDADIIDSTPPKMIRSVKKSFTKNTTPLKRKMKREKDKNIDVVEDISFNLMETPKKKIKLRSNSKFNCMKPNDTNVNVNNKNKEMLNIVDSNPVDLTSIDIIDVCGDQELFKIFCSNLKKQCVISLAVACEYFKKEIQIGQKVIKPSSKKENEESFDIIVDNIQVSGISICWENNIIYYISFKNIKCVKNKEKISLIKHLFNKPNMTIKIFDSKEQCKLLKQICDINIQCQLEDPKVADWILEAEGKEKTLQAMVLKYSPEAIGVSQLAGHSKGVGSIALELNSTILCRVRASIESVATFHIIESQKEILAEQNMKLLNTFNMEMKSILCLISMESIGFGVDTTKLNDLIDKIKEHLIMLEHKAFAFAGRHFSMTSSKDVAKVLGIYKGKKVSTSKQILEQNDNPISNIILQWRKLSCTLTKMILPLMRTLKNNRIHGCCTTHSSTGRISMHEPNLQNVPRDFEIINPDKSTITLSLRSSFVPTKGKILISADYCQLELRILAHLSRDSILCKIMKSNRDVFKLIAAKLNKIDEDNVTDVLRQRAKQLCYGIIYGIGTKALSQQLNSTEIEAFEFMEVFKNNYPSIKTYIQNTIDRCKECGYVETLNGRRRYLPHINHPTSALKNQAERQAVNTTVQGSAADIAKTAMVLIDKRLCSTNARLVLHLHDEFLYEVDFESTKKVTCTIKDAMEGAVSLSVPLPVKLRIGSSWGELKEYEI